MVWLIPFQLTYFINFTFVIFIYCHLIFWGFYFFFREDFSVKLSTERDKNRLIGFIYLFCFYVCNFYIVLSYEFSVLTLHHYQVIRFDISCWDLCFELITVFFNFIHFCGPIWLLPSLTSMVLLIILLSQIAIHFDA